MISYKAPIHHLRRFGRFVSRLIPAAQRKDKFSPRSKSGCMMVSYIHDSTTTWKVWDPEFNVIRIQSDVVFDSDEEQSAHISCPEPQEADPLGLPQEEVHVEVLDTENADHEAGHYGTESRSGEHARKAGQQGGATAPAHAEHHAMESSGTGGCPRGEGGKGHGSTEERDGEHAHGEHAHTIRNGEHTRTVRMGNTPAQ